MVCRNTNILPGLSSTLQASVPLGRENPVNFTFPRFKMAASISRIELMSSGLKPITSMAFWKQRGELVSVSVGVCV